MVSLHINGKVRQKENNEMKDMLAHDFNPSTRKQRQADLHNSYTEIPHLKK